MSRLSIRLDTRQVYAWLKTGGPNARKGVKRALRRLGTKVQRSMVKGFRERGVGAQLFGRKGSGARKLIRRSRLRDVGFDIIQPLKLEGFAAIQDQGGTTKGHVIKPSTAPRLAFQVDGRPVFALKVNHPGARHPAIPFAEPALREHRTGMAAEIAKEVEKALRG